LHHFPALLDVFGVTIPSGDTAFLVCQRFLYQVITVSKLTIFTPRND
jgi:hypothetical protein